MRPLSPTLLRAILLAVVLALGSLPVSGPVWASAGQEDTGPLLKNLAFRWVNFLVLIGLLVYFVRKPLTGAIRSSVESVRQALLEAEASEKKARERLREAEGRMASSDGEVEAFLRSAREESEVEKNRLLAEADEAVEKIRREAASTLQQEVKRARDEFRRDAIESSLALAEEALRREMRPEDRKRFVKEYLDQLEGGRK